MKPSPPIEQPTAQQLLAELMQQRLTKSPELAAKQARLLAVLAERKRLVDLGADASD